MDNEFAEPAAGPIFESNVSLIDECDCVVANLAYFRGCCVDDGTAWEVGYGFAKGKACYGYLEDKDCDLKSRTELLMDRHQLGHKDFPQVEDFSGPVNLMLTESIRKSGGQLCNSLEECLEIISKSCSDASKD